jgi:hypothetical protein
VSVRGSIHYLVLPGLRRAELLDRPQVLANPSLIKDLVLESGASS